MNDRLNDLRQMAKRQQQQTTSSSASLPSSASSSMRDLFTSPTSDGLAGGAVGSTDDFFKQVTTIKSELGQFHSISDRVRALKGHALAANSSAKERAVSQQLNSLLSEASQQSVSIRRLLEAMRLENEAVREAQPHSSETRIRINLYQNLTRKFRSHLADHQQAQSEYQRDVRAKVIRQVRLAYPEATDREIEALMEADGGVQSASAAIRGRISGGHETAQAAIDELQDLQDTYNDLQKLQRSVGDIQRLYTDLAAYVETQGDLIDQIEHNVSSAKDYTDDATQELITARKFQNAVTKRFVCMIILFLILGLILFAPLFLR
ncbi:unnamed protein product [Vitrella brassicaformis CCMP3155]|uniref:t-SNARE coiled-coil homology domain-containing protein n=2 Tax=Vitrella brassicaformis TaxID=1169539 RepID=A0A0G4F9N5_VITBC|nr:unnamed protein product [Vitrella brassicaformis CCMP3155]|eukprot:CEM09079.1 unnamed protein product [Vitrella brassicaformis CCMP3155]